ncbi:MAG: hypothetical protein ACXVH7_09480 [Thermoanaerobaculia bacterium]
MYAYNAAGTNLTEPILNLAWLTIAIVASTVVLSRQRNARTIAALVCGLALLFPIISISDDFNSDGTIEEMVAVLTVIVAAVVLIALFRLGSVSLVPQPIHRTVLSDPRSPPRG